MANEEVKKYGFYTNPADSARYYPAILGYELNTRIKLAYLKNSGNKKSMNRRRPPWKARNR
ncbi:MAG: hypothetical protein COC06_12315 [Bacteroidales bacterium]|nr:MAG: hypothetical protein COC06_12315 [Bacteroidales bacterium]